MLEGAGLFGADVEVVVRVGDEDPGLFLFLVLFFWGLGGWWWGVVFGRGGFVAVEEVVDGAVAGSWGRWRCG